MLPAHMKAAQSLSKFKSVIKSWPGPTCSCHTCIAYYKKYHSYILITGDGICGRDGLVVGCGVVTVSISVFKIHAHHWDEIVFLVGFSSQDSLEGVFLTLSSVIGGGSHVGMTTFSLQWITTELLMKSHIYWYFKRYPFLWSYCDKIILINFMCILFQTLFL